MEDSESDLMQTLSEEGSEGQEIYHSYSIKSSSSENFSMRRKIEKIEKLIQKKGEDQSRITKKLREKKLEKEHLIAVLKPLDYTNCFRWVIELREMEMENLRNCVQALHCSESPMRPKTDVKYSNVGDQVISDMKRITYLDNNERTCFKELMFWRREQEILSWCPKKIHYPKRSYYMRPCCSCLEPKELNQPLQAQRYKMHHGHKSLAEEKKILKEVKLNEPSREEDHAYDDAAFQAVIPDFLGSKRQICRRMELLRDELKRLHQEDEAFNAKMRRARKELEAAENGIKDMESKLGKLAEDEKKSNSRIFQLQNQGKEMHIADPYRTSAEMFALLLMNES